MAKRKTTARKQARKPAPEPISPAAANLAAENPSIEDLNEPLSEMDEDMTPEQRFRAAWNENCRPMSPWVTSKGRIRGGLRPSERERGREILRQFGYADEDIKISGQ